MSPVILRMLILFTAIFCLFEIVCKQRIDGFAMTKPENDTAL